jgi:ABC-2 type transport system ATP-binding protein
MNVPIDPIPRAPGHWSDATLVVQPHVSGRATTAPDPSVGVLSLAGRPARAIVNAVQTTGLTRTFGQVLALDSIDLAIPRGSFYGIAGQSGAGKTTLIRVLIGLLWPDSGNAVIDGVKVWPDPDEAKQHVGFLPDTPVLFDRLTGAEMLEYVGLLRRMEPVLVRQRAAELLRALDLEPARDRPIAAYSPGMAKRIGLAVALLHAPRVLVLDEPFVGLDSDNARAMEEMLHRHRQAGGTVVMSSRTVDVVERLCDRAVVIERGRVRAEGTVAELGLGRSPQHAFADQLAGPEVQADLRVKAG